MLYNLEPDRSVTGGAWYCDQDFEAEFVDVLNQQCYRYLQQKLEATKDCKGGPIAARNISYASSKDVWKYISDLGISKVIFSCECFVSCYQYYWVCPYRMTEFEGLLYLFDNSLYYFLLSNVIY
jgi:hypothetical protein